MASYKVLLNLLVLFCAVTASYARTLTYFRNKGREARLVPTATYRGRSGYNSGGSSSNYGSSGGSSSGSYGDSSSENYNGGSTGSGYTPQQIPTQGGFVAGQGAYYGASSPFVNYQHQEIDIPLPNIEIPRFHFPTLPGGPPPLFLPTIDIPTVPYPQIDVPRIPPIHPPLVNFPSIPPVEGIDIPFPSVRFVQDNPGYGNGGGGGGYGGGGYGGSGGSSLYKRTGKQPKTKTKNIASSAALSAEGRSLKEAETREVPVEIKTRQIEIVADKKVPEVVSSIIEQDTA